MTDRGMTHPSQESEMPEETRHSHQSFAKRDACPECRAAMAAAQEKAEARHTGTLTTAFIASLMDRIYKDGGAEPMRTSMDYDEVEAALWAVASGAATEARRELLAKVEGLRRGDNDYIYGRRDPEFCETWNAAIDGVRELLAPSEKGAPRE